MSSDIFNSTINELDGPAFESSTQDEPLVYLSMLTQLRVTQNAQTLDLFDRTGRQAFGERLYLTSFERVQEMAWMIGECYDIELNMLAYT